VPNVWPQAAKTSKTPKMRSTALNTDFLLPYSEPDVCHPNFLEALSPSALLIRQRQSILWTQPMSGVFIWSLGSSLAALLLATLNIVRAGRPQDKRLATITLVGTACWALVAFAFGKSIGNVLDPRPLGHAIISLVLVIFSGATLWGRANKGLPQGKAATLNIRG
jgi:hypothetical protein